MTFETQLNEIVKDYRKQYTRTPETVLRVRAITDVIILIEKNISVMMLRIKFNRHDPKRSEILLRGLDRLELRHSRLIGLLDRRESLPTNETIHQTALNYITRNGTIDNPGLRDEVFIAYKSGCYWTRKQNNFF